MQEPYSLSINYCTGPSTGYRLSTTTTKVDDYSVLDPYTSSNLTDFLSSLTRKSQNNGDYNATNSRKRHNPYITPAGSKKFKDDGCSIFGEVITPLPLQSGNLLSPPIVAASSSLSPLIQAQAWLDILEEPEEVSKY